MSKLIIGIIIGIVIGIIIGSILGALVTALAVSFKQVDSRIRELMEEEGDTKDDQ